MSNIEMPEAPRNPSESEIADIFWGAFSIVLKRKGALRYEA